MKAYKWSFKDRKYYDYELPKGTSCFEADMNKMINCASCGKILTFGDCYTSKQIQTMFGFGYGVCPDCYNKEFEEIKWEDD